MVWILLIFWLSSAKAQDLGVHGPTFAIGEASLWDVIQKKLQDAQKNHASFQKKLTDRVRHQALYPAAVAGLTRAVTPRSWLYDPSVRLTRDVIDEKGRTVIPKGTVVNPLKTVSWGAPLIFVQGEQADQMAWAQHQDPHAQWVLVNGSPVAWEKKLKRPVYFDQGGVLIRRLGIRAVPAVVRQEGLRLRVEEIVLSSLAAGGPSK